MAKSAKKAKSSASEAPQTNGHAPEPTAIEIAAETMAGDIRDKILDLFRGTTKGWTELEQREQQRIIDRVSDRSRQLVRESINLIADRDLPSIELKVGKWTVKEGELKIEVSSLATEETVGALIGHSSAAVLVLVDASSYYGERAPALADKDQPDLPLAEAPKDSLSPEEAKKAFEATQHLAPQPAGATAETPAPEEAGDTVDTYRRDLKKGRASVTPRGGNDIDAVAV